MEFDVPGRHQGIPFLAGLFLVLWATCAFAQKPVMAEPMKKACFPSLESAIRIKGPLDFCGEFVPLHLPEVRERLEKELLLMLWDRAQAILWLKRSGRYFPHIQTVLRGANMPDDLKYVAVIESALKPRAGSRRGARGVWQFIASTGRKYGLSVDRAIDDRRNFYLSTRAAARYMRDLHDQFGSWTLACAAYNMGENGLVKQVKKQEVKDYYHLHLPTETQRYVLRAIAAKLIMADPAQYGFDLHPGDYYAPIRFDRIKLKAKFPTPVAIVAKASGTYYKTIRDMNPQILGDIVPRGEHVLFLPEGAANNFADNYRPLIAKYRKQFQPATYTVKRGDSLTVIARRHNMSLWQLCRLNRLTTKSTIRPGQKLYLSK